MRTPPEIPDRHLGEWPVIIPVIIRVIRFPLETYAFKRITPSISDKCDNPFFYRSNAGSFLSPHRIFPKHIVPEVIPISYRSLIMVLVYLISLIFSIHQPSDYNSFYPILGIHYK